MVELNVLSIFLSRDIGVSSLAITNSATRYGLPGGHAQEFLWDTSCWEVLTAKFFRKREKGKKEQKVEGVRLTFFHFAKEGWGHRIFF